MPVSPQSSTPSTARPNRAARRHPEKASEAIVGRRWATIVATAEYLGVTRRTVRKMIADGRLPAHGFNKNFIRIDLNEVDNAMTPYGCAVTNGEAR